MNEQDEIIDKACKVLMCRNYHLTLFGLMSVMMDAGMIDTNNCEFGNNEEHLAFFKSI